MSNVTLVRRGAVREVGASFRSFKFSRTWLDDLATAIADNLKTLEIHDIARTNDYASAARVLDVGFERAIPYKYEGSQHRVVGLIAARARKFGACTEAAGAAAAVGILMPGMANVALCVELDSDAPGYSHVRTLWQPPNAAPIVVDPYAAHSRGFHACSTVYDVRVRG